MYDFKNPQVPNLPKQDSIDYFDATKIFILI
jgi:hypothetical protein